MNKELLTKRYRELVGHNIQVKSFSTDDLAASLKLAMSGKEVNKKNLLITKMESNIETLPYNYKPFGQAILEIYKGEL